jgi:hypothetical protein
LEAELELVVDAELDDSVELVLLVLVDTMFEFVLLLEF